MKKKHEIAAHEGLPFVCPTTLRTFCSPLSLGCLLWLPPSSILAELLATDYRTVLVTVPSPRVFE
jgi:hypothetical protein